MASHTVTAHHDGFPFTTGKRFAKIDIGEVIDLEEIRRGFERVPLDPYVADGSRCKDLIRFRASGGRVTKGPHGPLVHPINAGHYGGINERTYSEIPEHDRKPLIPLIEIFSRLACVRPGREMLLQRQRVVANDNKASRVVQEGRHQDGLKKLAILVVARPNTDGGITYVSNGHGECVFTGTLKPGEMIFIDDAELWHDGSPISPIKAGQPSYRDVILLNWPAERAEDHIHKNPRQTGDYHAFYPSC